MPPDRTEIAVTCLFCQRTLRSDEIIVNLSVRDADDWYLAFGCHLTCLSSSLKDDPRNDVDARIRELSGLKNAKGPG